MVSSLPGVLSRHDMECVPSEQMENIPMVVILRGDSRQKQLTKTRNESHVLPVHFKKKVKMDCYVNRVSCLITTYRCEQKVDTHLSGYHGSTQAPGET